MGLAVEAEDPRAWMMDSVVGVVLLSCRSCSCTDTSLGCWTPWQQKAPVQQQREPSRITDDAPTRSFVGSGDGTEDGRAASRKRGTNGRVGILGC